MHRALIDLSNEALRKELLPEENGLFRQITHDPVGVVYVIVRDSMLMKLKSLFLLVDCDALQPLLCGSGSVELPSYDGGQLDHSCCTCW